MNFMKIDFLTLHFTFRISPSTTSKANAFTRERLAHKASTTAGQFQQENYLSSAHVFMFSSGHLSSHSPTAALRTVAKAAATAVAFCSSITFTRIDLINTSFLPRSLSSADTCLFLLEVFLSLPLFYTPKIALDFS